MRRCNTKANGLPWGRGRNVSNAVFSSLNIYSISGWTEFQCHACTQWAMLPCRQQIHILCVIYFEQIFIGCDTFCFCFFSFRLFLVRLLLFNSQFLSIYSDCHWMCNLKRPLGMKVNQFGPNRCIWTIFNMICYWKPKIFK